MDNFFTFIIISVTIFQIKGLFTPNMFLGTTPSGPCDPKTYYDRILLKSSSKYPNSRLSGLFNTPNSIPNMYRTFSVLCRIFSSWNLANCLKDCLIWNYCCGNNQWIGRYPNTSNIQNQEKVVLA